VDRKLRLEAAATQAERPRTTPLSPVGEFGGYDIN